MKAIIPTGLIFILALAGCKTPREAISKIGIEEGWRDDTRFLVVTVGAQSYYNEAAKVASKGACAAAAEKIPQRFSELILGGDTEKRCAGVDPAANSLCDWNYRLDPTVFTFKGVEVKRRHDFTSQSAFCEIAMEYRDPDLKDKAIAYAARFNITAPAQ